MNEWLIEQTSLQAGVCVGYFYYEKLYYYGITSLKMLLQWAASPPFFFIFIKSFIITVSLH